MMGEIYLKGIGDIMKGFTKKINDRFFEYILKRDTGTDNLLKDWVSINYVIQLIHCKDERAQDFKLYSA